MSEVDYHLVDLGDRRVLTVDSRQHVTTYSERVVRMLIERKGARRAALYLPFKQTRGRHFLSSESAYAVENAVKWVIRSGRPSRKK